MSRVRHITIEHPDLVDDRSLRAIGFEASAFGTVALRRGPGRVEVWVEQPALEYDENAFQQWLHDLYADGSFIITEHDLVITEHDLVPTTTTPDGDTDA